MEGQAAPFQLRILQGQTRFPVRPLAGQRFVIGGGSQCHLQLGGNTPMVHSLLVLGRQGWELEALVPFPLLMVNGQSVRKVTLVVGDVIEIGGFTLQLERTATQELPRELVDIPVQSQPVPVADALGPDPESLSAAELVDRLDSAMEELEALESRKRQGWERLLGAVKGAGNTAAQPEPVPAVEVPSPWAHLEAALESLTAQVNELHQRESGLLESARQMEQQQAQLLKQIEQIRAELAQQKNNPGPKLKISA